MSFGEKPRAERIARDDREPERGNPGELRRDSLSRERFAERFPIRAARIDEEVHRGRRVVGVEDPAGGLASESVHPAPHEKLGVRRLGSELRGARPGPRRRRGASGEPAQHCIHEFRRALSPALAGVTDGFVDGGIRGDPVEAADLVQPDLQDLPQVRREPRERGARHRRELRVQRGSVPQHAEDDLAKEVAVGGGEIPLASGEEGGDFRPAPDHLPHDLGGVHAYGRGRPRGHQPLSKRAGSAGSPRRNSAPETARRPSR